MFIYMKAMKARGVIVLTSHWNDYAEVSAGVMSNIFNRWMVNDYEVSGNLRARKRRDNLGLRFPALNDTGSW